MDAKTALLRSDLWRCSECRKIYWGFAGERLERNGEVYCTLCIKDASHYPCEVCSKTSVTMFWSKGLCHPVCSKTCAKKYARGMGLKTKKVCLVCFKPSTLVCGGCKINTYCSRECQRTHWTIHKPKCRPEQTVPEQNNHAASKTN